MQTLSLHLEHGDGTGTSVAYDRLRMPLLVAETEPEPEPAPNPDPEPESTPEPEAESNRHTQQILLLAGLVAILTVLTVLAVLLRKKTKKTPDAVPEAEPKQEGSSADSPCPEEHMEETLTGTKSRKILEDPDEDPEKTFGFWSPNICRITLTDIHSTDKFYQKTIDTSLSVGFSPKTDFCIDYDRTVSRLQCEIIRENKELFLVNHSKSNITQLNGYDVTSKAPLPNGGVITMGNVEMRVQIIFGR